MLLRLMVMVGFGNEPRSNDCGWLLPSGYHAKWVDTALRGERELLLGS
jgi:hypothetical protein